MNRTLTSLALIALTGCAAQSGWRPTVGGGPQYGYGGYQQPYRAPAPAQGAYYQSAPPSPQAPQAYSPPPAPNQYGDPNARLAQDQYDCEIQARAAANPNVGERATDAVTGGLVGAALGAAVGAVAGDPGAGAAIGAAAGGIGNAARGAVNADDGYKRAYANCLGARGHNVVN